MGICMLTLLKHHLIFFLFYGFIYEHIKTMPMTDRARDLLDKLLGVSRNETKKKLSYLNEDNLCIFMLAGFCPFKALENTKKSIGKCPYYEHKEVLVECLSVEKLEKYENELLNLLQNIIGFFEKNKEKTAYNRTSSNGYSAILNKIENKIVDCGLDTSIKLTEQIVYSCDDKLADLLLHNKTMICEICGTQLCCTIDSKEYQTHVDGKLHQSCLKIRLCLSKLLIKYSYKYKKILTDERRNEIHSMQNISYKKHI